ncbi:hypothetical protein D1815_17445 [Aquimarina sp. AD1]|uniref:thiopeptide-type bacteriocin biosynthesis protein n=3 Tax=Aquimarina sp. (strain AD1) TaxID=1714848 RepID=UPI000E4BA937|nr:thiopeptide-type bacteriocin biosynthesis protein [Aquimarina sp. AD1]AXT57444.1 hypothetical protein D1815_17445 [Aquimarina sp. AD1]
MLKISFLKQVVVRSNNFSIDNYRVNHKDILGFYNTNDLFKLSVLIASYDLHDNLKINNKTRKTLSKYFKRAHFNPVPFGIFSSVGIIPFNTEETIINKNNNLIIDSCYDNFLLNKISIKTLDENIDSYKFYPNPSIRLFDNNRMGFERSLFKESGYLETKYIELDYDDDINFILTKFYSGKTIDDVLFELTKINDYDEDSIKSYLLQLFDIGMIISDKFLFPYNKEIKTGNLKSEFLSNFAKRPITKNQDLSPIIKSIENDFKNLKNELGDYSKAFSTTSFSSFNGGINRRIQKSLIKYIQFSLVNSKHTPINDKLKKFGNKFYHTFCDGLTPLNKVFDSNYGMNYEDLESKPNKFSRDILAQLCIQSNDDLILQTDNNTLKNEAIIPKELKTFGVIFEILECKKSKKQICYIKSMGGANGLNLITRFNNTTEELCREVAGFEKSNYKDSVLAEINLVPQARAINILARKKYYDYSISVNTVPTDDRNIQLKDLFLHFDGNDFHLYSKSLKKTVVPRLTSAIDYSKISNLVYQFLCDLQYQNAEIYSLSFDLNNHIDLLIPFVPRIFLDEYTLLYPSQLLLTAGDYNDFEEFKTVLFKKLDQYKIEKNLVIPDSKGNLIIEISNNEDLMILYKSLNKHRILYVSELIYNSYDSIVQNEEKEGLSHELLSVVKNKVNYQRKQPNFNRFLFEKDYITNASLISDWFCIEIYCNTSIECDIIQKFSVFTEILDFFFVRYNYPNNHIRFRFKIDSEDFVRRKKIMNIVDFLVKNSWITTYKIVPYLQELNRYGGKELLKLTETIFIADSKDYINRLSRNEEQNEMMIGVNRILYYFEKFELNINDKIKLCEYNIRAFSSELKLNSKQKKDIMSKVRNLQDDFRIFHHSFDVPKDFFIMINEGFLNSDKNRKYDYITSLIHMSLNRHFKNKQRLHEYKSYLNASYYLKKQKFLNIKQ